MRSGTANNAGAILVVGRGLVIVPKLIHPLPPPLQSPETSPERVTEETWMQVLNTIIFLVFCTCLYLLNETCVEGKFDSKLFWPVCHNLIHFWFA